ncbi:MAG: hypothetical protein CM15mP125_3530 [Gammaproteobacteria bacterium]|nr:MAG: hypothetical protein CM15mP125_3530 [Gammaproteobacteria bacterium]
MALNFSVLRPPGQHLPSSLIAPGPRTPQPRQNQIPGLTAGTAPGANSNLYGASASARSCFPGTGFALGRGHPPKKGLETPPDKGKKPDMPEQGCRHPPFPGEKTPGAKKKAPGPFSGDHFK